MGKQVMIEELTRRGYDSDPIKAWKKSVTGGEEEETDEDPDSQEVQAGRAKGPDYDYLLGMPMWNLTKEKKDELCKKRDDKQQELEKLKATSKEDLWIADLDEFMAKLGEVEAQEAAEDSSDSGSGNGGAVKGGSKKGKAKKGLVKVETLPSAAGIRVIPRIAEELKIKAAKIVAAKERKANKEEKGKKVAKADVKDEFDEMADGKPMKQTKLSFKPKKEEKTKAATKGNPWSDSDASEDLSGSDIDDAPAVPRERPAGTRRAATTKQANYQLDESDSDEIENIDKFDSDEEKEVPATKEAKPRNETKSIDALKKNTESDAEGGTKDDSFDISDSDDNDFARKVASAVKKPPPKKLAKRDDLFKEMMAGGGQPSKKAAKKVPSLKKAPSANVKKKKLSEEDEDKPSKKVKTTKKVLSDSSDFDDVPPPPRENAGGRSRAPVSYQGLDESDSDF